MSGKNMHAWDAIMLAAEIVDNGALSVLNLASNKLGELVLPDGWLIKDKGKNYQKYVHTDGREQTDHPGRPDGLVTAVANAIKDMGAMTRLNLSNNGLLTREGGSALGNMLKANTILKELDVSDSWYGLSPEVRDGPGFAQELAVGIKDNGAMTSLNLSGNELGPKGAKHISAGIRVSKCVIVVVLAPFSCPFDHWLICCCLLLTTGYEGVDEPQYVQEPHQGR
jgi:hypothetical protein